MDGENANGSEHTLDESVNKKVTQPDFFQQLLLAYDPDAGDRVDIVQVLCEDLHLLSLFQAGANFSAHDLSRIALSRLISYEKDLNLLHTQLREGTEKGWTSIVINGKSTAFKAAFDHFQLLESPFSVSSIQPASGDDSDLAAQFSEVGKPWLIDQTLIGVQRHRDFSTANDGLPENLQKISLAQATNNIAACEPHLRRSSLVGLHLDSLTSSFAGIGFSGQSACQLAHYAGRSSYCNLLVINGVDPNSAKDLLLPMLWYFMYGRGFRVTPTAKKMRGYIVEQPGNSHTFYSDERTQKWWLENPASSALKEIFPLIACSYEDYQHMIKHNELSLHLQYTKDLYEAYQMPEQ